jgi:hypothetical protein
MARRRAHTRITPEELAVISDCPLPPGGDALTYLMASGHDAARLWQAHGAAVLEKWIEKSPGTRPTMWWRFSAPRWEPTGRHVGWYYVAELPEPRKRLGGTGTPACETMAYVPSWPTGLPEEWADDFDELDPPVYESQASYLKRHGLLEKGELKRLNPEDFEPETAVDLLHADDEDDETRQ